MYFFFHWLYSPLGPWPLLFQIHDHFTDGRTPWTGDQPVARPLPKHRTTQTQNKHIHTLNIHALCGIRTHDPGFRASEDSTCLRSLGYRDLRIMYGSPNIPTASWLANSETCASFCLKISECVMNKRSNFQLEISPVINTFSNR
jgi:hypothetical protein